MTVTIHTGPGGLAEIIKELRAENERLQEQARRQASLLALPEDQQQEVAAAYVADWQAIRAENERLKGWVNAAEQRAAAGQERFEEAEAAARRWQLRAEKLTAQVGRLSEMLRHIAAEDHARVERIRRAVE